MADECQRLLSLLDRPDLRQIAIWKVEGWTNEEIDAALAHEQANAARKGAIAALESARKED